MTECCQTCASISACDGDVDQECASWARQGFCDREENKQYMLENCCFSCNHNWTESPGGAACEGDRSQYCQQWAKQGYCQIRPMYMNQTCCQTCQDMTNFTGEHCKALNASSPKDKALNIVLVPSAFNGDMELWSEAARNITDAFSHYKPLDVASVPFLNVWYVDIDMADDDGHQCSFGCFNVERSLWCDGKDKFMGHAKFHCGTGFIMNTLIVHNSDTYGGAGLPDQGVAFVSRNELSPLIAIHELGHSLFGLVDEYSDSKQAIPETSTNCDYEGCPKWKDLEGRWGVGCVPGKCKGGQYFVAEESIMEYLRDSLKFGVANERVTCCKYLYHFGATPEYCQKFSDSAADLDLRAFCSAVVWKGSLPSDNLVISLQVANDAALPVDSQVARYSYMANAAQDPQGAKFEYVSNPREWIISLSKFSQSWSCVPSSNGVDPGLYSKQSVKGDVIEDVTAATLTVEILGSDGALARYITFLLADNIELPAAGDNTIGNVDASVLRPFIVLILSEGEVCQISSASAQHETQTFADEFLQRNQSVSNTTTGSGEIRPAKPFERCQEGDTIPYDPAVVGAASYKTANSVLIFFLMTLADFCAR